MPLLTVDELLNQNKDALLKETWTTPPARFNDGTLVEEMEKKGIGRPATYAAIIANITARAYIAKNKEGRYYPSEMGIKLCKMLVAGFPNQMDISFTAKMENNLDEIEAGTQKWKDTLKAFWSQLLSAINSVDQSLPDIQVEKKDIPAHLKTGIHCTECETGEYVMRKGTKGDFLACSNYPVCKSTKNFKLNKKGKAEIVEPKKTYHPTETCSLCNSKMAIIKGKNGKFLSCDNYPTCKGVKPMPLDFTCATCNVGKLIPRKSQAGKEFFGCSRYPECKQVYWNKPVNQTCSKCNHIWMEEVTYKDKETKKKKTFVVCPVSNCKIKRRGKTPPLRRKKKIRSNYLPLRCLSIISLNIGAG